MNELAIGAIILSTFLHAGWNAFGKNRGFSLAYFNCAMGIAVIIATPIFVLFHKNINDLPVRFWFIAFFSGMANTIYMTALSRSYQRGELSVVYPLVRCFPVIFIPLFSVLFLGNTTLSWESWCGISFVIFGAVSIPLSHFRKGAIVKPLLRAFPMTILAAGATTAYSLLDKVALEIMISHDFTENSAGINYLFLHYYAAVFCGTITVFSLPEERRKVSHIFQHRLSETCLAGAMMLCTTGLVLTAVAMSKELSHVIALRQLSLPVGFLIGILCFKEQKTLTKFIGIFCILAGLGIIVAQ